VSFVCTTVRVAIGRSRPLRLYITYNPVPDLQSLTRSVYFKGNGGPTRQVVYHLILSIYDLI